MAVVCLTLAVGGGGFAFSGFFVNHLDIAPPYAGLLFGLSNMVATLPGIISPLLTGVVVQHPVSVQFNPLLSSSDQRPISLCNTNRLLSQTSHESKKWSHCMV